MWFIVKTDFFREREAIDDLLRLDGVDEVYFPVIRQAAQPTDGDTAAADGGRVRFVPAINGIMFVYSADLTLLTKSLNPSGYFILPRSNSQDNPAVEQVRGNAHLFSPITCGSLGQMLDMAAVTDEEMYRYKVCVEQRAATTDEIRIIGSSYERLAAENDTIKIIDGPFRGFTGVIKQVKSGGVKDRHLMFRLGSMCVSLSGIRRYNYIVVRESSRGGKAQMPNMWRYIDYLTGRLQASYFADNAQAALRNILCCLDRTASVDACRERLLGDARRQTDDRVARELALQAVFLQQMSADESCALMSLRQFFQSVDGSVGDSLGELVPDMPLRPFLTPTPGVDIPTKRGYALFAHNGFHELVLRLNLKHEFLRAEDFEQHALADRHTGRHSADGRLRGRMRLSRRFHLTDSEYVYYTHIAFRPSADGMGLTAMVNWGGFLHRYVQLSASEREAFLASLADKGYDATLRLLRSAQIESVSPVMCGFLVSLPGITSAELSETYCRLSSPVHRPASRFVAPTRQQPHVPLPILRRLVPLKRLLDLAVPAAVEFWQRQRLLEWRHLVQRFVLLHNLPVDGNTTPH